MAFSCGLAARVGVSILHDVPAAPPSVLQRLVRRLIYNSCSRQTGFRRCLRPEARSRRCNSHSMTEMAGRTESEAPTVTRIPIGLTLYPHIERCNSPPRPARTSRYWFAMNANPPTVMNSAIAILSRFFQPCSLVGDFGAERDPPSSSSGSRSSWSSTITQEL